MRLRMFHCSEGSSHKFWSVTVEGSLQTVRYGRIATPGQTQTKTFVSPSEAEKAAAKLVAEKLRKGYAEVAPETAARVPGRRLPPRRPVTQLTLPF